MIIDVGCGGNMKMQFQLHGTIQADVYLDLRKPKERKLPNFIQADLLHLPFKDDTFEKTFCHHVVEHLFDPIEGMTELLRITKGLLEIRVPHRFWKLRDHNKGLSYGHKHHFSMKYFKVVFKNFDAEITITEYKPLFPFFMVSPQEIMIRVWKYGSR